MRYSILVLRIYRWLSGERGDTASQITWSLALLVGVSVLGLFAANYLSPEWADHVDLPNWFR